MSSLMAYICPVSKDAFGSTHTVINYFDIAKDLLSGCFPNAPRPFQTFSMHRTAFHLLHDPISQMSLDKVVSKYDLPDLKQAFFIYIAHIRSHGDMPCSIGG